MDVSLGRGVTDALKKHHFSVVDHKENFSASADDVTWLTRAGKLQRSDRKLFYIVITKDKRMHSDSEECAAIREAGLRHFAITSGNMTGEELQHLILESVGQIADIVLSNEPPYIARITKSGVEINPWPNTAG